MLYFIFQHEHPYVSAMVNNGSLHYDHDRDGTHTMLAGCEAKFRNKDYDTFLAIRFQDNVLKVIKASTTKLCVNGTLKYPIC